MTITPISSNNLVIYFTKSYSHYLVAVEYRFVGEQCKGGPDWAWKNSGVMLHCQPPETMLKDQDFPISIEEQLLGGPPTGDRHTANLCTPGTNVVMNGKLFTAHCTQSNSPLFVVRNGCVWRRWYGAMNTSNTSSMEIPC